MIIIDADGCPVKDETYRVAQRYGLKVTVVANSLMRVPQEEWLELVLVDGGFNAADDWIAEHVVKNDIVVTADIPLAARCMEKGGRALNPRGEPFTEDSIGDALASRELMSQLRDMGAVSGGPAPFDKRDRSRFLHSLDGLIQAIRRGR
ncbi:MAG: YaiI/YqxD family protein [Nitrospirota bacterium]|nr:YaiI/YqxD family protein [Nitrospirota bacterium]